MKIKDLPTEVTNETGLSESGGSWFTGWKLSNGKMFKMSFANFKTMVLGWITGISHTITQAWTFDNNKLLTVRGNTDSTTQDLLRFETTRSWKFQTLNNGTGSALHLVSEVGGKQFCIGDAVRPTAYLFHCSYGAVFGSASGGAKGLGTLNAIAVYDDNILLTCYVIDQAVLGEIDLEKWDAKVPNRVIKREGIWEPVLDKKGKVIKEVLKRKASEEIIERKHEYARKFLARIGTKYDPLTLDGFARHWKEKGHLSSYPNEDKFDPEKGMSTGDWIQRGIEVDEILAVHIETLNQQNKDLLNRVEALEAKLK